MLLVLFQYVSAKRIFEDQDIKLTNYRAKLKTFKDSIVALNDDMVNQSHFNLNRNEDAISYFEKEGLDVATLIPFIKDELYRLNEVKGQHPIVPYASGEGRRMMINTVKILNHKWIIADFSDGEYWGEVFLTYEVTKQRQLSFNLVESFLYPFN
ncbi:hypothetical protein GCM10022291_05410 [Postechiella marina]|uniref:Hydrolase n=2 Tax=Postechiella marina TaxID=943941 RepID=A0ABP8C280_9FLAO